jgi:hypothetical protein
VRLSWPARGMGFSPGEESLAAAIAVQAIEAQPAFGQIKPMRGQVLASAKQHVGDVPSTGRLTQGGPTSRRRKRKPGVQKGGPFVCEQTEVGKGAGDPQGCSRLKRSSGSIEVNESTVIWRRYYGPVTRPRSSPDPIAE